ncbi:MAG: hypothetical protein NVSMB6_17340 [Burkholderiaceae bacterium]
MRSDAPTQAASDVGFVPLSQVLQAQPSEKLSEARARVVALDRAVLINKFRDAFDNGKRVVAFILADELTRRGIPPCFWHADLPTSDYGVNQKLDLLLFDLRWLRHWHADHVKQVRYMRYKELFTFSETKFHRAAEYAFYGGTRPYWKIVGSLSLNQCQQWDCAWLRSAPIGKRHAAMLALSGQVLTALRADLTTVRRTKAFGDSDADATLQRRHALWVCAQMTGDSPTETALRYRQMTGDSITRQTAAKQLEKVREILTANRVTTRHGKRVTIV